MYGFAQGAGDFFRDFNDESGKIREANDKKNADQSAIEQRALEHLANADDPQIRAAAVTAMLTPKRTAGGGGAQGLIGKWFGQQRDHPVFDQVHQLINGGNGQAPVQPFLSEEDKAAGIARGRETGRIGGANEAYANVTGEDLPAEDLRRAALGSVGAPPPRPLPMQYGTITLEDGTKVAGTFDQSTGEYSDSDGNYISGAKGFERTMSHAGQNPNSGGTWQDHIPDKNSPTGYSKIHVDASGKELGRTAGTPPPPPPPLQVVPTAGGLSAVDTHTKTPTVVPIKGGEAIQKPEDPSAAFNSLRQTAADIEARVQKSVPHFGGLPANAQKVQAARDAEAKTAGFASWQDLQDQLHAAQQKISGAVQPGAGGAPPAGIDTASPAPAPAAKPGAKPTAAKPGGKPKAALPSKIDINAVLAELNKIQ